ncbi:lipopolysaccharide biosynthesis protein [Fundidesulfovibrio agrisoli]|uniref:lipopolysaccharide biosynthesis protein n=1 Tax=Fundidesulfovibrio agrisoli TaxID=2922717 RepID=UPI0024354D00|nr:oligosaccharide flippase family protein [Fundidesulfovibrio agrisoli]
MKTQHSILKKFLHLACAQWVRDGLHTLLIVLLARASASTYGEFVLAFSLAQFILFLGEFGLNQPMVVALSRRWGDKGHVLAQYGLIKAALLGAGMLGVLGFCLLQGYSGGLLWMSLGICAGCGLEPLAGSFFVALRVQGRQDLEAYVRSVAAAAGYGYALAAVWLGWPAWSFGLFKVLENLLNLAGSACLALRWEEVSGLGLGRRGVARAWRTAVGGLVFVGMALAAIGYNKANVFFLQRHGGAELVGAYGVAWELVDGASNLVASLLLSGVIYPLLVKLWRTDKEGFAHLARSSARTLTAVSLPVMAFLAMESDRLIPLIFGEGYRQYAWVAPLLTPSIMIAFLHNLAAYMMLAFGRERLLLAVYTGGLLVGMGLCWLLVPGAPLMGAAVAIVATKAAVGVCTVGYCQRRTGFMSLRSAALAAACACLAAGLWLALSGRAPRELAEAAALAPLAWLLWRWRPRKPA